MIKYPVGTTFRWKDGDHIVSELHDCLGRVIEVSDEGITDVEVVEGAWKGKTGHQDLTPSYVKNINLPLNRNGANS